MELALNYRTAVVESALPEIKENIQQALKQAEQGKHYELLIRRPRRSNPQNDYWHTLIRQVADKTGYTVEEAKFWVKGEILGYEMVTIHGKGIAQPRPSSDLTTDEMSELIERTEVILSGL